MTEPTLTYRPRGEHRVVHAAGELDFSAIARVTEELEQVLQQEGRGLIMELSQTTFLDSAAIKLLYDVNAALAARGQRLRLVVPPENLVRRTLELTGTTESFPIHADLAEALDHAASDAAA